MIALSSVEMAAGWTRPEKERYTQPRQRHLAKLEAELNRMRYIQALAERGNHTALIELCVLLNVGPYATADTYEI